MLNNLHTDGHTWREGGVTLEKVRRRAEPIREAIPAVYEAVWPEIERTVRAILEGVM